MAVDMNEIKNFKPHRFERLCRACGGKRTFEQQYSAHAAERVTRTGVEVVIAIDALPFAYCIECKTVVFTGRPIKDELAELEKALEEAEQKERAPKLVVPRGPIHDLKA